MIQYETCVLARVRAVEEDGCKLFLEYLNGNFVTLQSIAPFEFDVGDIVNFHIEGNQIEKAPAELWPNMSRVGIIRMKEKGNTIVDSSGILRVFPTREDIDYKEGYTVEFTDSSGIISVLAERSIRDSNDLKIDESFISKFRTSPASRSITFEDFGGSKRVIERARELVEVPLKYKKELREIGARPIKGVLFTGLPGTGKTMLARIIAHEAKAAFYEISGPEVFSKWYGESEEIIRKLFEDASRQEQAIVFFDEIDSVASQRAEESHEASRRVVAQLLTVMDGFDSASNVIVIAATNRPQDIDVALRRPGRFDWEVNFSLPEKEDRQSILEVSARQVKTRGIFPHSLIAQKTESWSAAELTAIWSEAALLAVIDHRSVIFPEDYVGGFERVSDQRRRVGQGPIGGVPI